MSVADDKFKQLTEMVQQGIRTQEPRERTEAEEDQIALELFILEHEGPESLAEYQANPTKKCLRYADLPAHQREIIARARTNRRDFPKPAPGGVYAPGPEVEKDDESDTDDNGLERDDYPTGPGYRARHMGEGL